MQSKSENEVKFVQKAAEYKPGNPFLPLDTYIADGEPHVFGNRVYLFGSQDMEGGSVFCPLDYVGYSAPVDDLTAWRCEGTIYRRDQDPRQGAFLYAPDVVRGNDGRYYLYYSTESFSEPLRVAVCDEPAGRYQFYGFVRNPDGTPFTKRIPFDPAVINDDGIIRLYYGWGLHLGDNPINRLSMEITGRIMFGKVRDAEYSGNIMGAFTVEVADDMLTVKTEPQRIVPCHMEAKGTKFAEHSFYEGSSIRKVNGKYYFIYSSQVNHELCYAVSDYPDRDFKYGGVIISNGDVGYHGRKPEDRLNATGNNHGSIECINGQWYVFYHRHTHNRSCCRQACAEKIEILPDGSIPQAEMTSTGLKNEPYGCGSYPAATACNLHRGRMNHIVNGISKADKPCVSHDQVDRFISNIRDNTWIAYKYVLFRNKMQITALTRGNACGVLEIYADHVPLGTLQIQPGEDWREASTQVHHNGVAALQFHYRGNGNMDFLSFSIENGQGQNGMNIKKKSLK